MVTVLLVYAALKVAGLTFAVFVYRRRWKRAHADWQSEHAARLRIHAARVHDNDLRAVDNQRWEERVEQAREIGRVGAEKAFENGRKFERELRGLEGLVAPSSLVDDSPGAVFPVHTTPHAEPDATGNP